MREIYGLENIIVIDICKMMSDVVILGLFEILDVMD